MGAAQKQTREALVVEYRSICELTQDPRNARVHSRAQLRHLAKSIEAFGFNVPVLVDVNSKIIAGHGRLMACQLLGWETVPTIQLEHLSSTQAKAFNIADNALTDRSSWDEGLLAQHLKELSLLDLNFDLEAVGFEMAEIDLRIESLDPDMSDENNSDVVPACRNDPSVSLLGDLWELGRNRLFCGSALDEASYDALMGGRRADIVFTDPPYNVPISGHVSGLGAVQHSEFKMASGEMTKDEFIGFLTQSCRLLKQHTKRGSIHFFCIDWRHVDELSVAGRASYSEIKNICVWVKHNAGMGSLYRSQHELIFVFKNGQGPHQNNIQLGKYGRHRSNVWSYRGANDFGRGTEEGNLGLIHPTVKPVALVADAILDCSRRKELVLDPFLGSGTTMIAAERTGRACFGMEIDPYYVDSIIRRWQIFTGEQARHSKSRRSFQDLASEQSNVS